MLNDINLYRDLLNQMSGGYALYEILRNDRGEPVDYRFLEVNAAFERLTTLKSEFVIGRTALQVMPHTEPSWIDRYGKVAQDGKPLLFEIHFPQGDCHCEVKVIRTVRNQLACFFTDITARRRIEERLDESESKYRDIFDNIQETFFEVSLDGMILEVSPSVEHLSKGQFKRKDLIGKPVKDLYADYSEREKYLEVLQRQGFVRGYEIKLRNLDESIFDGSVSSRIQCDRSGKPVKIVGSLIDITERKRAQEAFEKRLVALGRPLDSHRITFEELFNLEDIQRLQDQFADATGVASLITQPDGTPITRPSNFCRLCSDIIRKSEAGLRNCFHSDAIIGSACIDGPTLQTCLSGGLWDAGAGITVGGQHIANWLIGQVRDETQTEEKIQSYARQIGIDEAIAVEAFREVPSMSLLQFKRISQVLFTLASQLSTLAYQNVQQAHFITELKQVEDAITKSEVLHRKMIANIGDVIVIIDRNGINRYKSPNVEKLFGWKPEELTGVDTWNNVHPEDVEYTKVFLDEIANTPNAVGTVECRYRCKDGRYKWIEFTAGNLLDDPDIQGFLGNYHDITERKQVEQTLSESEERFKVLHNASFGGILIHDMGIIIDCNQGLADITGYATNELIGMNGYLLIAEQSRDSVIEKSLAGYEKPYEATGLRKNGEEYPIRLEARNIPYKGKIIRTVEFRDITEQKQAEATLQLTRFSIDHASDAIFWTTPDAHIVDVNEAACRALGYSREELLQLNVADVDPNFQEEAWINNLTEQKLHGAMTFESEHRTKDGRLIPVEIVSNYVQFGTEELICGFVRDITERKHAEAALLAERRYLTDVIDSFPDPTFIIDNDGCIVVWNRAIEEMTKVKREGMLGKGKHAYAIPFYGERRPILIDLLHISEGEMAKAYSSVRRNDDKIYAETYIQNLNDGKGAYLSGVAAPLYDQSGMRIGAIEVIKDITEIKQAEKHAFQLREQLLHAQKIESVGRLAGGVAHDFNNMLSVILGNVELAMNLLPADDPILKRLHVVSDAAKRSAGLTQQLLAFARKQPVSPKLLDLNETVEKTLKMLRRLIGEDIDLAWLPGGNLGAVTMDPSQIDQLLVNLCVNARDAIGNTGKISIETHNLMLAQTASTAYSNIPPGRYVILALSDNGCGMDSETLSHLFEPFFTTKDHGRGTGLGLATVYGIVKQNNGYIDVSSEPGRRTVFTIYLPASAALSDQPNHKGEVEEPVRGTETVLLVEDEPLLIDLTKTMLEGRGYTVMTAKSPAEAIQVSQVHQGHIDLLITDVIMPEMNGRDLARVLSAHRPGLKVLFISGYTADVIAHHGVLDKGVHFLQKPITGKALADKVRETLEAKAAFLL